MKLSKSLLGAIMVGVSMGVTVGCTEPEVSTTPNTTVPDNQTEQDNPTEPDSHSVEVPNVAQPTLPVSDWEDACPGCGRG